MQTPPWYSEYNVFGIPNKLPEYTKDPGPVYNLLYRAANKFPKSGVVQLGSEYKYPEIKEEVEKFATGLSKLGIKKGDRIVTLLPTSIQFIISDYAISMAGGVQVPCSPLEAAESLEKKLKDAAPKMLICSYDLLDTAHELKENLGLESLIVTKVEDYSTSPPANKETLNNAYWFRDIISNSPPAPPAVNFDSLNDLETLLFTGGTTGVAKGCMLTHKNIYVNSLQNSLGFGSASNLIQGVMAVLLGLPFFHSFGHCVMHSMTFLGAKMLLVTDPRDTRTMVDLIKKHRPIMQIGVPTQFMKLLDEELQGIGILGLSGSAALPSQTQEQFEKKSGGGLMEGYGLSEMSPVTHLNPSIFIRLLGGRKVLELNNKFLELPGVTRTLNALLRVLGSKNLGWLIQKNLGMLMKISRKLKRSKKQEKRSTIGIPLTETNIKLLDVDTGETISWEEAIKQDKSGEMLLDGPQKMLGYWPEAGKGLDREGYVRTGDVVKVDEQGYFYIVDRTKDMIVISGYKVYSRELDEVLYDFPGTEMAATVGTPDPDRPGSERVVVYMQLNSEYQGQVTEQQVIEYLKARVAKYAVPKRVYFLDEIPLTDVQKVDKKKLRQMVPEEN